MWLDKLRTMKEKSGFTTKEISSRSGFPEPTLEKLFAGSTKDPKLGTIRQLVHFLGYTLDGLDDGPASSSNRVSELSFTHEENSIIKKYRELDVHGKRAVTSVLDVEYDRVTQAAEQESQGGVSYIDCFDLAVSAGLGEPWSGDSGYKNRLEVPTDKVPEKARFCARVNGRSMEPAYYDGDIVFVQHLDGESVSPGEIGFFVLNGEGYIKRLGHGVLESLNPAYDPIPIHNYDDLQCQGRVLGKV